MKKPYFVRWMFKDNLLYSTETLYVDLDYLLHMLLSFKWLG